MENFFYAVVLTIGMLGFHVISDSKAIKRHQELMQKLESISDPCQQIHDLETIESRDYKPKYNRELKQVVSTCGALISSTDEESK